MKFGKKFAPVVLAGVLAASVGLAGCSNSSGPSYTTYTANSAQQTPGYEGDCWDAFVDQLILNSDGTYTMVDGDYIVQQSGVVVMYTTVNYQGTYKAGDKDSDGIQKVTLSAPTEGTEVAAGSPTTSKDDPSILEDYGEQTVSVNTTNGTFTYDE